jgi:hypothetical protein
MGVSGQHHALAALYPRGKEPRYPIGGWVGPRAGLDTGTRRKILCPCRGSNPDRPARSQTLYCLNYLGSSTKYCTYEKIPTRYRTDTNTTRDVGVVAKSLSEHSVGAYTLLINLTKAEFENWVFNPQLQWTAEG